MGNEEINICYADDIAPITDTEDDLQRLLCNFHLSCLKFNTKISIHKTNDKSDHGVKPGAGICLTVEENPRKPQIGDHLLRVVLPVIASNGVPCLQMKSLGFHNTSGREKEGKKQTNFFFHNYLHNYNAFAIMWHLR